MVFKWLSCSTSLNVLEKRRNPNPFYKILISNLYFDFYRQSLDSWMFNMNTVQIKDHTIKNNANDKLDAFSEYEMTKETWLQTDQEPNTIDKHAFSSVSSVLSWLKNKASSFSTCTQAFPCNVSEAHWKRPYKTERYLAYVQWVTEHYKVHSIRGSGSTEAIICNIVKPLVDNLSTNFTFHITSWTSHKSKFLLKSFSAAEVLAALEGIDIEKDLTGAYAKLVTINVKCYLVVASKDIFKL